MARGGPPWGAARAWNLPNWDIDHTYEGLQINQAPNITVGGGIYITLYGRLFTTIDLITVGFSESVTSKVMHIRPQRKTGGEMDKLNEDITYIGDNSPSQGLNIQSGGSAKRLTLRDGRMGALGGIPQRLVAQGMDFNGYILIGTVYGYSYGALFESCRCSLISNFGWVLDGANSISLTATTGVSYANGTITLTLATISNTDYWSVVPGMILMLAGTASDAAGISFTGDAGALMVLGLRQDTSVGTPPNYIYIDTDGPASLPSWATGMVAQMKVGPVEFRKCTGPDVVTLASDASDNGQPYFQYYRYIIKGNTNYPYSTAWTFYPAGLLTQVLVNVSVAHPTGGATLVLTFRTYTVTRSAIAADTPGYTVITIDLTTLGLRTINTAGFNKLGSDALTIAGASQSALGLNRMTYVCSATITAAASVSPTVSLVVETDCGIARRNPVKVFGGQTGTVLDLQGTPQ